MKHINTFGTWSRINEAEEMAASMDAPMDAPEPSAAAAGAAGASKTEAFTQALREMPKKIEAALADTDSMTKTAVAEITRQGYTTKEGVIKQIVAGCTAELKKTISTSEWYEAARTGELTKSEVIAGKIQAALIKAVKDLIEKNKGAYASSVRGLPNFTDEKIKTVIAPMAVDAVREAFKAQLVKFADPSVVTGLNQFYRNFGAAYKKIEPGLEASVTQILTSVKPNAAGKAAGFVAGIFG